MSQPLDRSAFAPAIALFALAALAIAVVWWWLGLPVVLPPSALAPGQKLSCVSYAPFRDDQDPRIEGTFLQPAQIEADLALLAHYTECVRTYSIDEGLDAVPAIAQRHGLKVLQGLWLSDDAEKNRTQIANTVALAKQFPDVIRAVVVGNEVLLRGEMTASDLTAIIRQVKSQVPEPVTYADVWEFWLRYSEVANAVDFVTIHILPYWEDVPLRASMAAAHVDAIRKRVAAAIPGKEIFIGEVGWPSAGRMREAARPSPSNQARVIEETLALAHRENFRLNVIEAFDQPWKRWLEGAVGGHWGIFSRAHAAPKFNLAGGPVSDHPRWPLQALAGIFLIAVAFVGAFIFHREEAAARWFWPRIAAMVFPSGVLLGWTIEMVPIDSFDAGGWIRSLAFAAAAIVAPIACTAAFASGRLLPNFAGLLGGGARQGDAWAQVFGGIFIALVLLAVDAALALVFDPRYRDIPFAPLCGAAAPFLLGFSTPRQTGARAAAESAAALLLALSAAYILFNESFANWQALWFCAGLAALAFILAQARAAPVRE